MSPGPHDPPPDFLPGKKSRPQKDWAFWERLWEKQGTPLMVGASVVFVLVAAWLVTEGQRNTGSSLAALSFTQAEELRLLSLKKEAEFETQRLNKAVIDDGDLALLGEAVQAQQDYLASRGALASENVRLETMRRRYHVIQAERQRSISTEAEDKATALAKSDPVGAIRELRRALEAERFIESRWFFSGYADVGKIARLDTRLRRLEAEPLRAQTQALEAQAEVAFAAGRFDEAIKIMGEAIETEQAFVEKYRDVLDTEFARVERLSIRQETMRSHPLYLQILAAEAAAAEAIKGYAQATLGAAQEAQATLAVEAFERAMLVQAQLEREFPRSKWATVVREANFAKQRNRWRSAGSLQDVEKRAQTMASLLRAGQVAEALDLARALREKLARIEAENPGVVPPEDALRRQLEYVVTHAAIIQVILPKLDQLVAPVAGSGVRMMKQEISQGFYSTVMGVNPSASMRENLPVESVAYANAQAFCEALGWICGRPVRLPTVAEYKAAMGDLALPPAAKNAWTFDNTDGVSARPVGTSQPTGGGLFDLLGNVEEWAQAEATDDFASVVGGSVNWVPVSGLPLRKALKREKSRTIGFRIVIE
jgi:tetratricopeptide (TPR) repeat protein